LGIASSILDVVLPFVHQLFALALIVLVTVGNVAVCAGWAPTPEARMACCVQGETCPMHRKDFQSPGEKRVISQTQADVCCAASERQQSSPSTPALITMISSAVLGAGVIVPAPVPALVASDAWRAVAPIPIAPIPKHVLLSVFLI
jgi:hypothetical protein